MRLLQIERRLERYTYAIEVQSNWRLTLLPGITSGYSIV